ncbi:FAD-dependent oxidoreductase [Aestuariivirga litoralis]|uniref:FAD-dependent oxidoreductase n=1 Tax=Aestuariivirga litoralis TaxID=2650924 RepID=A0A2W2ARR8_9HYPH|nr:FAD-dependent oxidoreductase [Aestuariivirga litoralis]
MHLGRQPLPRSLYAETAQPLVPLPDLREDVTAAVVIVGGGFTGLSTALHLAELGIDAVVLEANEPGWGASGRNGGQVNAGFYLDPSQVLSDFGPDMGQRMLDITSSAPNLVFDIVRRHAISCEAAQTGTLRLAFNRTMLEGSRSTYAQLQRTGSPATWVDRDEVIRLTGTERYLGGIRFPQCGKLNPLGYARGLAAAAIGKGARIFAGTPATGVMRQGTRWKVTTPGGSVTAERLVIATNAYTDGLWPGLRESIVPVFSSIVATAPLSDELARQVLPSGSVVYEIANNTVYYRLDAFNRLLMGGEGLQRDVTTFKDARALIDYTRKIFPRLANVEWTHVWNGKLAVTPDFYIHMHEPAENVHICLGYSGRGVAMGTAMGGVLARRINGTRRADLPMPVTDMKSVTFHRFHRIGVKARLLYGRYRDMLDA